MKQTSQAVCAIKQSIYLDVYDVGSLYVFTMISMEKPTNRDLLNNKYNEMQSTRAWPTDIT